MLGHTIQLQGPAKRIVSLVPSQTELLFDLGLEEEVIGITKFCIHPASWLKTKKIVGGTKTIHIDIIRDLQPDLIIANKEENVESVIRDLQNEFPVWISDVNTLDDATYMIQEIGVLCGRKEEANQINTAIRQQFDVLKNLPFFSGKKVAYFIWKSPWLSAGKYTFIDEMLTQCGFENVSVAPRYPEVLPEELSILQPDFVFLSSEPYPFKEEDKNYLSQFIDPAKIHFVDGTFFSWYGSKLKDAPAYFISLFSA